MKAGIMVCVRFPYMQVPSRSDCEQVARFYTANYEHVEAYFRTVRDLMLAGF